MSTHHIRAIICKMFKYTSQAPKYIDTIYSVKTVPQLQQHIHVYTTSNASMYSTVSILTCERQAVIMYDKFRVMHDTPQRRRHRSWDAHSEARHVRRGRRCHLCAFDNEQRTTCTYRRRSLRDGIVTVRQRVHAVVQYIPLVVEAQLIYFDGVNYMVSRSKYLEF